MTSTMRRSDLDTDLVAAYRAATPKARAFMMRAAKPIPRGASRDALAREPYPPVVVDARGAYLTDLDGHTYLDVCLNLGPILLGHGFEPVDIAVKRQLESGLGYGAPTALEARVAERVIDAYTAAERVRFLSTGTEAILYALRVARAYTGRRRIVKFIGAYHGSYDAVHYSVRPAVAPGVTDDWRGIAEMAGLAPLDGNETLAVPYNDTRALRACLHEYGPQVAAVIVDPAMNACGLAAPKDGFLRDVRDLTHAAGALLVFDEVVTGFRYGLGGAAATYSVHPDLVAFGKVLGAGLPIGAFAGSAEIMDVLDPGAPSERRVMQSGTYAANPLTMAASLALLDHLEAHPEGYAEVADRVELARQRLRRVAEARSLHLAVTGTASLLQIHAGVDKIDDYADFARRDQDFRRLLFLHLAINGIFAPGPTGTFFFSWAHTDDDMERFTAAVSDFLELWSERRGEARDVPRPG